MHLPFTPNHVQLISACYPPNAALLNAGPEYRPNSQELSRMTYYASNRPGKINKLASELEKRVRIDSRKAKAGNVRARASLLVSLAIIKALATECRRDLALLTAALLASVNVTLTALSHDLEVAARAGSVFTAWTTYTDGHLIGVDQSITQDYMSCLQIFSQLGSSQHTDQETMNRTRLVGLAALTGVVTSEALYNSTTHLKAQASTFMAALFMPLLEVDVAVLNEEATEIKVQPTSPYLSEFRKRPTMERRATSIHLHVTGETGPADKDVANAAMRALSALFGHSNGSQAAMSMQAAIDCFNDINAWEKQEHCCWFAVRAAEWTQYQYRYAIPTRLVECLVHEQDAALSTARHSTLAAMITTVFTSPTPLVNLSTSDIISTLISVVLRRVSKDAEDPLLPALVQCISSLGTHVYYADQIQDLAGELISRLVAIESGGVLANGKSDFGKARTQAVRCLLAGLLGLIHAAEVHDVVKDDGDDGKPSHSAVHDALAESSLSGHPDGDAKPRSDGHTRPSRRSNVSPEVWQDTLSLLCDGEYAVRVDYATTLVSYLQREIPKLWDCVEADGVKRIRPLAEGPTQQAAISYSVSYGDTTTRFLHAVHAHLYVLATASSLGTNPHSRSQAQTPSTQPSVNGDAATPANASEEATPPQEQDLTEEKPPSRRSLHIPRARKMSFVQRILRNVPSRILTLANVAATISDYGNIAAILKAVQSNLPVRGLLTGVPMLLALDSAVQGEPAKDPASVERVAAIREVLASTWLAIGKVWDCSDIVEIVQKSLPAESSIPSLPDAEPGTFCAPREPVTATKSTDIPSLDSQTLLMALVSNQTVQDATGLDRQTLLRKLSCHWTPESAFKESVEVQSPSTDLRNGDGLSPLVKVSPAFMHIDNLSRASLARSTRGVGVTDLREALEGRSSLSNPNLRDMTAASLSTLEHTSLAHGDGASGMQPIARVRSRPQQRSKLGGPGEVRDVLNKLGIGKVNGSAMLKPSFTGKKSEQQRITSNPPYKA